MSGRAWIVVRLSWTPYLDNDRWWRETAEQGGRPVVAFADESTAEEHRAELEREARRTLSPAAFGVFPWDMEAPCDGQTSLPGPELLARLRDLGFDTSTLPAERYVDEETWLAWWDLVAPDLTPDRREAVWALFDKLRLYEVVAVDLED